MGFVPQGYEMLRSTPGDVSAFGGRSSASMAGRRGIVRCFHCARLVFYAWWLPRPHHALAAADGTEAAGHEALVSCRKARTGVRGAGIGSRRMLRCKTPGADPKNYALGLDLASLTATLRARAGRNSSSAAGGSPPKRNATPSSGWTPSCFTPKPTRSLALPAAQLKATGLRNTWAKA